MEVDISRGPVRFQILDENEQVEAPKDRSIFGMLADGYALGAYGQIKDTYEELITRNQTRTDPNFDGLNVIPRGYEQYADAYAYAQSQEEVDLITGNIDENLAIRKRQSQLGFGTNLMVGLVTGILDPVNLIPVPGLKGLGFVQGALKGGTALGTINAAQEVVRNTLDPTSTNTETAINIGMGFLVAGAISGGIAHFNPGHRGTVDLDPEIRAKAEQLGDNYAKTHAAIDGIALRDVIDFKGQGVRVIDGNTGKYDSNGNYVRAFFRPKEAFEAAAQREAVSRAADSALGDVIPDSAPGRATSMEDGPVPVGAVDEAAPILDGTVRAPEIDPATGQPRPTAMPEAAPEGRAAAPEEAAIPAEDTIFVDSSAILAEFPNKPWANPRYQGIKPFAEDAFKTPEEWLNFVALHELHHVRNPRLPTESKAAYENRINELAYQELEGLRAPLSPTDSTLEKLSLIGTVTRSLMGLAPRNREVHQLIQDIAGNMQTMMIANRMNKPTTPGGSVQQRSQRWLIHIAEVEGAINKAYVRYVRGVEPSSNFGAAVDTFRDNLPLVGRARQEGKLKPEEFAAYVGRAINDPEPFELFGKPLSDSDMTIVRGAVRDWNRSMQRFERDIRELGMFENQKRLQNEIAWREKANTRDAERLGKMSPGRLRDEITAAVQQRTEKMQELQAQLDEIKDQPVLPANEENYFSRIFDIGKIKENYDDFVNKLAKSFGGDEGALGRAKKLTDEMIGRGGDDFLPPVGPGAPRNTLGRQIPLTNKELIDYIVTDPNIVMGIYARRMGPAIEMMRKFGSLDLEEQFDALRARLQDDGFEPEKIQKIVQHMEDARDRVLNRFHSTDPMNWNNRTARALKNLSNLQTMGEGIYSQTVDMFRSLAVIGYKPFIRSFVMAVKGELAQFKGAMHTKAAGEGYELILGRHAAATIEEDSALLVTQQTGVERALAKAQPLFFKYNLMAPFTVALKEWVGVMTQHVLLSEAQAVAKAIRSGKTLTTLSKQEAKMAERLASLGINVRDAQLIADMPFEKLDGGDLLLPNMESWTGRDGERARDIFMGALQGNITNAVVTPGPLDRMAIMDGVFRWKGERKEFPLLGLPFQLMGFGLASGSRITHALLSGRDRSRTATVASLMMGSMFALWLRDPEKFERMEWDEIFLESFEKSGIVGIYTDLYKRVETLTGYGPRNAMDAYQFGEDTVSDDVGAVTGPALGTMAGVIEAFVNPDLEDQQRAGLIRRAIPMAGMVWWSDALKELSNWAVDAGMIEETVGDGVELDEFMAEEDTVELSD